MVAVCIALAVNKQVMYTSGCKCFIKGWAPGKLTGCKGDFVSWVAQCHVKSFARL